MERKEEKQLACLESLLVTLFFQISRLEEFSVREWKGRVTLREIHVLEAVDYLSRMGENKMLEVARLLGISPGSLTTAANVLTGKGCIYRITDQVDRRSALLFLTEKGEAANRLHSEFHRELAQMIFQNCSPEQTEDLMTVLELIEQFFALEEKKLA